MNCYNKFAVSYGLIVITKDEKVMLIKRKIPYCVQNFYIFLYKHGIQYDSYNQNPYYQLKELFECYWLPYLDEYDQIDYQRFKNGTVFEDMFDYPHGQIAASKFPRTRLQCFMNAYREFREETGFRFSFIKEDIDNYPLVKVEFQGCDQQAYTQYYFIIENVKGLRRFRYFDSFTEPFLSTVKINNWKDDRLAYKSYLVPINDAYKLLKKQQVVKKDYKYLLLLKESKYILKNCLKHKHYHWQCSVCRCLNTQTKENV